MFYFLQEMRLIMKLSKRKDPVKTCLAKLRDAMDLGEDQDPLDFALTRDDFSSPGDREPRCPDRWWRLRVEGEGLDPALTNTRYLDIVARSGSINAYLSILFLISFH